MGVAYHHQKKRVNPRYCASAQESGFGQVRVSSAVRCAGDKTAVFVFHFRFVGRENVECTPANRQCKTGGHICLSERGVAPARASGVGHAYVSSAVRGQKKVVVSVFLLLWGEYMYI